MFSIAPRSRSSPTRRHRWQGFPPWSLQSLVILACVVQIFGVASIISYVFYRNQQAVVGQLTEAQLDHASHEIEAELDHYLRTAQALVDANALAIAADILALSDLDNLAQTFWHQMQAQPRGLGLGVATATGEFIGIYHDPQQLMAPATEVRIEQDEPSQPRRDLSLDALGQPERTLQTWPEWKARSQPWYQTAQANPGTSQWLTGETPTAATVSTLDYVVPLVQAGEWQGVLHATVPLIYLNQFLSQMVFAEQGHIIIMDDAGQILATSAAVPAKTAQTASGWLSSHSAQPLDAHSQLVVAALQPQLQELQGAATTHIQLGFDQPLVLADAPNSLHKFLVHVSSYEVQPGLNWLIITTVPRATLTPGIGLVLGRTVLLMAIAIASSVGLAVWISRRLTRSLRDLQQAAETFTRTPQVLPEFPQSQIQDVANLTQTFHHLATEIQAMLAWRDRHAQDLEQQVAAQTQIVKQRELQLNDILDNAIAAIVQTRLFPTGEWQYDFISPQYATVFGYTAADIEQQPDLWRTHIHPEDWQTIVQPAIAQLFASRDIYTFSFEYRFQHPDGTIHWVLENGVARWDEAQSIWLTTIVDTDITAQKQVELELQAAHRDLSFHLDNAPIAILEWDQDFRLRRWSHQAEVMLGWTSAEAIGQCIWDLNLVHPDDVPAVDQVVQDFIHQRITHNVTANLNITKTGELIRCVWYNSALRDPEGQLISVFSMGVDITLQQQTEQALKASEAKAKAIIQALPDLLMQLRRDGLYLDFWSTDTFKVIGLPDSWVGLNLQETLPPDLSQRRMAAIEAALTEGRIQQYEQQINLDGIVQTEEVRVMPMREDEVIVLVRDISDRKRAEADLKATANRLKHLIDSVACGIVLHDHTGRPLSCNRVAETLLGRTEAELRNPDPLTPPLQLLRDNETPFALHDHPVQQAIATRQAVQDVVMGVYHPQAESWIWLLVNAQPQIDEAGTLTNVVFSFTDITALRVATNSLRASEARFRAIFDQVAVGINQAARTGQFINANQAFCDLVGYTQAELLTLNCGDLTHPEDFHQYAAAYGRLMRGECRSLLYEKRYRHKRGHYVWAQVSLALLRDRYGEIVSDVAIVVNINDLKQTQLALHDSQRRFQRAFEDAAVGMALMSPTGQFLRVNQALCDFLGYANDELLQLTFAELTHPDDIAANLQAAQRTLAGDMDTYQLEKRYIHKQGHFLWALLGVSLVRDDAGQPQYFIAQVQNIGRLKQVDQIKTEFISTVSHELRTPLTAIQGALGLLKTGIYDHNPEQRQRLLDIAATDAERLVRLVNDILDIERLESGRLTLEKCPCDLAELVTMAIASVQPLADQQGMTLRPDVRPVEIWAASDYLVQVLVNLLSNAVKFSPPQSTIDVSMMELPTTDQVQVAIRDRGRGIPSSMLETVFDRFQQVDASDARQKAGTGLGLAICKQIIEQHHGHIWVESELGQGSTFYFTVPRLIDRSAPN